MTVVAGYYVDQRSIADVVQEVSLLKDAGCRRVKIMLKGDDANFDTEYASAVSHEYAGIRCRGCSLELEYIDRSQENLPRAGWIRLELP